MSADAAYVHTKPAAEASPVWTVRHCAVVTSTQQEAAGLPAWSAVVAERQSGGRGQYDRTFTSDAGGFYLTAVLPYDGGSARWRGFALAVGWAVQAKLRAAGVTEMRLRWPNDLMIGPRKVGGILVEQGGRHTLLVGIGINVGNRPWEHDAALRATATRLADHAGGALTTAEQLREPVLAAVAEAHEEFSCLGLAGFVPTLNACWQGPRSVELMLADEAGSGVLTGFFLGLDRDGCLLMKTPPGALVAVPPHRVRRLREV